MAPFHGAYTGSNPVGDATLLLTISASLSLRLRSSFRSSFCKSLRALRFSFLVGFANIVERSRFRYRSFHNASTGCF